MPLIDRRANLTPANMRAADVARKLIEQVAPMQQARQLAAHHVNGIEAILYSRLGSGRICTCRSANTTVAKLSPDGKASPGAINRVIAGNDNFGISAYDPTDPLAPTIDPLSEAVAATIFGVENRASSNVNNEFDDATVADDGQFSPDLDNLFGDFDMGTLGISDVSCPICFGSSYVGGYSPFRTWRYVLVPADLDTNSYLELPSMVLSPGDHSVSVTLPKGACGLDVFRTMHGDLSTASTLTLDGQPVTVSSVMRFCDGRPHTLRIVTPHPLTHVEMQFALSKEPIYFEIPKLTKNADISFLEQQEPFQIIVSPDVPDLKSLDVIAESQLGKILIVQSVNPWNTRNRQMLGFECMVRVAQPQELWRILPFRAPVAGQKTVRAARPSKSQATSGVLPQKVMNF